MVQEEEMMTDRKDVTVICSMIEEEAVVVVETIVLVEKTEMNWHSKLAQVEVHQQRNENPLQISPMWYPS